MILAMVPNSGQRCSSCLVAADKVEFFRMRMIGDPSSGLRMSRVFFIREVSNPKLGADNPERIQCLADGFIVETCQISATKIAEVYVLQIPRNSKRMNSSKVTWLVEMNEPLYISLVSSD